MKLTLSNVSDNLITAVRAVHGYRSKIRKIHFQTSFSPKENASD